MPSRLLWPEREQLLKHITPASPGLLAQWVPLSTFQVSPGHTRGPRRSRAVGVRGPWPPWMHAHGRVPSRARPGAGSPTWVTRPHAPDTHPPSRASEASKSWSTVWRQREGKSEAGWGNKGSGPAERTCLVTCTWLSARSPRSLGSWWWEEGVPLCPQSPRTRRTFHQTVEPQCGCSDVSTAWRGQGCRDKQHRPFTDPLGARGPQRNAQRLSWRLACTLSVGDGGPGCPVSPFRRPVPCPSGWCS